MRLTESEITAIKQTIAALDVNAKVYLFGSRVDDTKRGGDIDLLIMSEHLSLEDRGKIRWRLWELIGEQKIDIIIAKDCSDPFVRIALNMGLPL